MSINTINSFDSIKSKTNIPIPKKDELWVFRSHLNYDDLVFSPLKASNAAKASFNILSRYKNRLEKIKNKKINDNNIIDAFSLTYDYNIHILHLEILLFKSFLYSDFSIEIFNNYCEVLSLESEVSKIVKGIDKPKFNNISDLRKAYGLHNIDLKVKRSIVNAIEHIYHDEDVDYCKFVKNKYFYFPKFMNDKLIPINIKYEYDKNMLKLQGKNYINTFNGRKILITYHSNFYYGLGKRLSDLGLRNIYSYDEFYDELNKII